MHSCVLSTVLKPVPLGAPVNASLYQALCVLAKLCLHPLKQVCIIACLPASLRDLLACMPACLPASFGLLAYLPACLLPCLPPYLPTSLSASLPACTFACLPHVTRFTACHHAFRRWHCARVYAVEQLPSRSWPPPRCRCGRKAAVERRVRLKPSFSVRPRVASIHLTRG